MLKQIEEHILEIEKFEGDTLESVEHFRIKYLGKLEKIINQLRKENIKLQLISDKWVIKTL